MLTRPYPPQLDHRLNGFYLEQDELMLHPLQAALLLKDTSLPGTLYLCSRSLIFHPTQDHTPISKVKLSDLQQSCFSNQATVLPACVFPLAGTPQCIPPAPWNILSLSARLLYSADRQPVSAYSANEQSSGLHFLVTDTSRQTVLFLNCLQQLVQSSSPCQLLKKIIENRVEEGLLASPQSHHAQLVTLDCLTHVLLSLSQCSLLIHPLLGAFDLSPRSLVVSDLQVVVHAPHRLHMKALLIFSESSCLKLVFPCESSCGTFYDLLCAACPGLTPASEVLSGLEKEWRAKNISNFGYLMGLNHLAGRCQHDLDQYPILPWLVNHYEDDSLAFDGLQLRELGKPIGLQNKFNRQKLTLLKEKKGRSFLFSSFLSQRGVSAYFLLRKYPWLVLRTQNMLGLPRGRVLRSIQEVYEMTVVHGQDYKELIPEFFYDPEVLLNNHSLELGHHENEPINHVQLPLWAESASDYVSKMQGALESPWVSDQLHQWINLIFGKHQQCGCHLNEFPSHVQEPQGRLEGIQGVLGEMPLCLFPANHPFRLQNIHDLSSEELNESFDKSQNEILDDIIILGKICKK